VHPAGDNHGPLSQVLRGRFGGGGDGEERDRVPCYGVAEGSLLAVVNLVGVTKDLLKIVLVCTCVVVCCT
jgi:hypothetical protein